MALLSRSSILEQHAKVPVMCDVGPCIAVEGPNVIQVSICVCCYKRSAHREREREKIGREDRKEDST